MGAPPPGGRAEARAGRLELRAPWRCLLLLALAAAPPVAARQSPAPAPSATAAERLDEARAARASGDLARARAVLAAAFAELSANARELDAQAESLALQLGTEALRAGAAQLAATLLRRGLDSAEARGAKGDIELERARLNLGTALRLAGELAAARALQERALAALEREHPLEVVLIQNARRTLAQTVGELGDAAAEIALRQHLAESLRERAAADPERLAAELELAAALAVADRDPEARAILAAVEEVLAHDSGPAALLRARADEVRGLLALRAGDPASAIGVLERALAALPTGDASAQVGVRSNLGIARLRLGDPAGALEALEVVLRTQVASYGGEHPASNRARPNLVEPCRALGDLQRAHALSALALAGLERALPESHPTLGVARLNRGLARPDEAPELDAGRALRALILAPLEPSLVGVGHVAIVPEGALHLVPFDALPLDSAGARAGDQRRIEVVRGAHDLVAGVSELGPGPLLAVGGLDFDAGFDPAAEHPPRGVWDPGFPPLPASDAEIAASVAYHERAFGAEVPRSALRGAAAHREAVERAARSAVYLQCATHGWFAPESVPVGERRSLFDAGSGLYASDARELVRRASPLLLSGLALSGANVIVDGLHPPPGRVSGEELAAWDLRRCELAVVSACETGVGVRRAGLSLASLRTALHRAGARRVVTSLWRVPDESTAELMLDFYRRLWVRKQDPRAALWDAKARLRAATDELGRPRHGPRDWAGWELSGPTG